MPAGVAVYTANEVLDWLRGEAPAPVPGLYVKLHTDNPGANGTTFPSAVTTRRQATMNAAAGGSITLNAMSGSWAMTTAETITHISVWDATTAGNFLISAQLTTPRSVANGDTLTMTSLVIGNTPIAA
ncbi:hypothetical protein EV641_109169 [Rhodococcus sp. SMB37]|uniref:phage tail fiber protein n=1 Tax=Rhodococcus sp. SMB37 TaxID=2512213 RepID=UPI00104ED11B|nr:hypothetical protein [Rhodococcus sp. SMB37]TCN51778.1 hypothetical protein EV641_109169 [Rhodococcus sp. SMB37]